MPCLRDWALDGRSPSRPLRQGAGDRLGLARDHALGRGRGRSDASAGTSQPPGRRSRATTRSRPGCSASRSTPGRWATPLHLEGSEEEIFYVLSGTGFSFQGEGDDEQRSPSGRVTASSTLRSSMPTRSAPATTGSSCSPSGSGTTPRTPCCRGPASRGSARPGCWRERRRITRGRERQPSALPTWAELAERPAADRQRRRRRRGRHAAGNRRQRRPRSRRRRRIGAHRARRISSSRRAS